jgi:hypothetical protein
MGSSKDLIDYQEGRREIPDCQVGKGKGDCLKGLRSSEVSSYQQGVQGMRTEEDQRSVLVIGGNSNIPTK